ncbi:serine/threonine protein kinase [Archangium violaceum]|uniref:serine/threonine protein kinase n=1 Tax=Archangium violaceum TaxID=83451 RepID=UPI001951299B|nr:serine/threonine protein kinase [Archangium violaceum]QRN95611.1 serine/threonine protein kinase [Archangium violaceum]
MPKVFFFSALILLCTAVGCATTTANVALRPDGTPGPEECPAEAHKAMGYVRLHVGDAALAELDANQVGAQPITLYDGPIESVLDDSLGTFEAATRLYGRVWTSGPQVVIRYYEAHPPGGEKVPICAVARLGNGQLRKRPESKPGTAILDFSVASVFVVDSFR